MNNLTPYSPPWFQKQKIGSLKSAEVVLPVVLDFTSPARVVDVGCGVGVWLEACAKLGVKDILGIDGKYVNKADLHIPEKNFIVKDLNGAFTIEQTADLVLCLEVGEHLSKESAPILVKSLTNIAPVILFSAAIPKQGGTNHLNEQWPDYWADLFKEKGYIPVDCVRRRVWQNPNVEYWYAQNCIVFVKEATLSSYPKLQKEVECGYSTALSLVHPRKYFYALTPPPSFLFRVKRKIKTVWRNFFVSRKS